MPALTTHTAPRTDVDFAVPLDRAYGVQRATEAIFGAQLKHGLCDVSGVLATVCNNQRATLLGRGASGKVYGFDYGGHRFALKTVLAGVALDAVKPSEAKLLVSEARIGAFLTRAFVASARCPNFVALLAYETSEFVSTSSKGVLRPHELRADHACVQLSEVFTAGTAVCLKKAHPDPPGVRTEETSPLADERTAFSLIAQTLVAIYCMSVCGVVHNDLDMRNVLAHRTAQRTLLYELPLSEEQRADAVTGRVTRPTQLRVRTHGLLFGVCDFGVASHTLWEASSGDPRIAQTADANGQNGSLYQWYFGGGDDDGDDDGDDADAAKPTRDREFVPRNAEGAAVLLMVAPDGTPVEALRYEANNFERDVAYFLSHVHHRAEHVNEPASRRVAAFALAVLREFDLTGRLSSAEQILVVLRRVLTREFAEQHFGAATAADFFAPTLDDHDDAAAPHVYRLPSEAEGWLMRAELCEQLDREPSLQELTRVVASREYLSTEA